MAQQNRTVLKSYFETGDTPTEAQFIDLIDSLFNITEDSISSQSITSTDGQTVFNFTNPVAGRLIFVDGMHKINGVDYNVTDTNQITFSSGLLEYNVVTAEAKN
jgi:hypothetical protein